MVSLLRFMVWSIFTWLHYRWLVPTDPTLGHVLLYTIGSGIASVMTIGLTGFIVSLPALIFSRNSGGTITRIYLNTAIPLGLVVVATGLYLKGS